MDPQSSPASGLPDLSSQAARQYWISALSGAALPALRQAIGQYNNLPGYHYLRSPEIGLAMVRGHLPSRLRSV